MTDLSRIYPSRHRGDLPDDAERQAALTVCDIAVRLHDCTGRGCRKKQHQQDREAARRALEVTGLIEEER